jgi:starvation-inducible DNA-binding protein
MFPTLNDLPEDVRRQVIELLNARLAEAIDVHSHAKMAHWNVKGPAFKSLHGLFDEIAEGLEEVIDDLAERAVQLGGVARGTIRLAAHASKVPEYPVDAVDGLSHVHALSRSLAAFGGHVRAAIDRAAELKDADTADLFTEISRAADKALWMVEAHGQAAK